MLLERYPGRGAKGSVYRESITYRDTTKVCLGPELRPLWLVWPTSQNALKDALPDCRF